MTNANTVAIAKGDNAYEQIKRVLELLGGAEKFIKKGQRVMLKVNVTGPAPEGMGVTTNLTFVEALTRIVCELEATPVIADGTASATIGTLKVFELSGYNRIAERWPQVEFFDLNRDAMLDVAIENPLELEQIKIAKSMYEGFDTIIDLPVIKTHVMTGVSLALKNLKGVIPFSEKRRFHDMGLHKCIADLASAVKPDLVIADGTIGCEGLGPKEGTPVKLGVVLAGTHMVTVDAAICYVIGFDPRENAHISYSHQKIGGSINLEDIEMLGDSFESVQRDFKPALPTIPEDGKITFINGHACSGCIGASIIVASRLIESGILAKLEESGVHLSFAIGPNFDKDQEWPDGKNLFFLGNCTKGAAKGKGNYFPGCAPASIHITEYLSEYYGFDHKALEDGSEKRIGLQEKK